jgi:hypothetical protein
LLIFRIEHIVRRRGHEYSKIFPPKRARAVVAFETNGENDWPLQQFRVGGTVRYVARVATFHTHTGMFENKGAALIRVALQTGLFVIVRRSEQTGRAASPPRGREASVRIVAIRALHDAFVDAVFDGHAELRANRLVTPVAKFTLLLCQQKFSSRGMMDRVAICTNHISVSMLGPPDIRFRKIFGMAAKAGIDHLRRSHLRESANRCRAPSGRHMIAPRPMTSLATGLFGRILAGSYRFEMRVSVKVFINIGMAKPALFAANELLSRRRTLREHTGEATRQQYRRKPDCAQRPPPESMPLHNSQHKSYGKDGCYCVVKKLYR